MTAPAGDVAIGAVVMWAGEFHKSAELEWRTQNACVEFSFDPPTEACSLAPNESVQVRVELRASEEGRAPVPWASEHIGERRLGVASQGAGAARCACPPSRTRLPLARDQRPAADGRDPATRASRHLGSSALDPRHRVSLNPDWFESI
jgi:hypothetical protein